MFTHNVLKDEILKANYSNKFDIFCIESSIFGKTIIDVQKIHHFSIQKRRIDEKTIGSYQKISIIINVGTECVEYSFEIDDQEKSLIFFREIERGYYASLKESRGDVKELFNKFGMAPNN